MDKMISISDAAAMLGVSTDTLREWDKKGLLSPSKTEGGHRRYSLTAIQGMQQPDGSRLQKAYSFVGGSHDGNTLLLPPDFQVGFAIALDIRGGTSDNKEVYQLEEGSVFRYQNYIMTKEDQGR